MSGKTVSHKYRADISHTRLEEHLRQAVHCLVGEEPIGVRLGHARAALAVLHPADIPEALRSRLELIRSRLDEHAEKNASDRTPSINMNSPGAVNSAREIVELYIKLLEGDFS
jgi:hypothetical protein